MWTKLLGIVMLTGVVAIAGGHSVRVGGCDGGCCVVNSPAYSPDSCCYPGSPCCYPGSPCCDGDCFAAKTTSCCPDGACCPDGPCCGKTTAAAGCCPGGACCPDGACCGGK
jgi:hypothetical protein